MQRELTDFIKQNIWRLADSPQEMEHIARVIVLELVLVCVFQAARKAWRIRRTPGEVPEDDDGDSLSPLPGPYLAGQHPAGPGIRHLSALWDRIAGNGGYSDPPGAGTVFPSDIRLHH